jgi:hypothetical protein
MHDPRRQDLTDAPRDQVPNGQVAAGIAQVMIGREDQARRIRRGRTISRHPGRSSPEAFRTAHAFPAAMAAMAWGKCFSLVVEM